MKKCYLCQSSDLAVKNNRTRDNAKIKVLQCRNCSLTFLNTFAHLKDFSYVDSFNNYEKNIDDIGDFREVLQGLRKDDKRRAARLQGVIRDKALLDFGCGSGGFLKLAKKIAKTVRGVEIDSIKRFYDKQIEVKDDIDEYEMKFDVITMFHVLEHVPDPSALLKKIKKFLKPRGRLIIEVPNDDDALLSLYGLESFRNFTYWSPHLFSFNANSLCRLLKKTGFRNIEIDYIQRYGLANHVGWMLTGKPGGQNKFKEVSGGELDKAYADRLSEAGLCDTLFAVIRND